ncbi:MAG: hypothetical protein ACLRU3_02170 [Paraclostridium sp.]
MDLRKKYKYKLETHLKVLCDDNEEYTSLFASWNLGRQTYKELLSTVKIHFPHYSKHDHTHSESIITNIEMLLGEECIKKLSPTDTWLILNCAYLHDLGMVILDENLRDEWAKNEFQDYLKKLEESNDRDLRDASRYINNIKNELKEDKEDILWPLDIKKHVTEIIANYYRGKHSQTSKEYLKNINIWGIDFTQNGLIHERLIDLIAEISFVHTQGFNEIMKMSHMTNGYNSDYAHPRFVAELIRIGDLLDLDNGRFSPYLKKVTGNNPRTSQIHNKKHQATRHILVTPEDIQIKADCPDDEVYRETINWISWLENEIRDITLHLTNIVPKKIGWYAPRITKKELLVKGKPDTNNITDLRFQISQEKAFDIIKGANIYGDNWVFIREFVQNALDASKIQLWNDIENGLYDPWIKELIDEGKSLSYITPFHLPQQVLENYKVEILINYAEEKASDDKTNREIEIKIKDRGTGISIERLKSMCDVGNSQSGKFKSNNSNSPSWLVPTGGFGIGLQSAFLLTNNFNIYTRTVGLNKYKIDISSYDSNGYITVREYENEIKKGTEIYLKTDKLPKSINRYRSYVEEEIEEKMTSFSNYIKDPFNKDINEYKNSKYITILALKSYIESLFNYTIFPIYIRVNNEDATIKSLNSIEGKNKCNTNNGGNFILSEKEDSYYFYISEDLSIFTLWDCKNSIHASISESKASEFYGMNRINNGITKVYFKGCKIDSRYRMARNIITTIDFYGLDTRENLRINREQFTVCGMNNAREESEKIEKFYVDTVKSRIDKYLKEKKDIEEVSKIINIDIYKFLENYAYIYRSMNCEFDISPYIPLIQEHYKLIPILIIENEKVIQKNMRIDEILKINKNISYIKNNDVEKSFRILTEKKLDLIEEVMRKYSIFTIKEAMKKYSTVIIDEGDYKNFFEAFMNANEIYIIDQSHDCDNNVLIINSIKSDKFEIKDDFTKKRYLDLCMTEVSEKSKMCKIRNCINNINGYEELLLDKIPKQITEKCYVKDYKIILPFTTADIEDMQSCEDKNNFIIKLRERQDYNALLDYTLDHQVNKDKKGRDFLSNKYQELVIECINILKGSI